MGFAVKAAAAKAGRAAAKKLGPVGPMFVAADLLKNAWHTGKFGQTARVWRWRD